MFCSSVDFSKGHSRQDMAQLTARTHSCNVCAWLPNALFGSFAHSTNVAWGKVKDEVCSSHLSCLKAAALHQAYAVWRRNVVFIYATKKLSQPIPKCTQDIFTNATLGVHLWISAAYPKPVHWTVRHSWGLHNSTQHSVQTTQALIFPSIS